MDRAYSLLQITKAVDEDGERVIEGMATTPEPDRVGDIVEPLGAKFANPLPLLWQHRHDAPVGHAVFGKPTKAGIPFRATIAKIEEPGPLRDRVDEAWQSVKAKLVRAVSIGFRSLEHAYIEGTGGIRFIATEILELSLVTVPANASATIQSIKSLDQQQRAASGQSVLPVVRVTSPGASGSKTTPNPKPQEGTQMNLQEQLKQFRETRAAKAAQMSAIMTKSGESGETLDAKASEEYDTLEAEVESIDKHLERLEKLEKANASAAVPVEKTVGTDAAAAARGGYATVKTVETLDKGIAFARYAMCLTKAKGNHALAFEIAKRHYPHTAHVVNTLKMQAEGADLAALFQMKAAVAAGTTTDATWAGPLAEPAAFMGDFIDYLRPRTLIGQANFEPIPFNVRIGGATSGGTAGWVGQGKAKPVTKFDFNDTTTQFTKVAAITVLTQELVRFNDMAAETRVRNLLAGCVIERVDSDLFDPDIAAVTNVNPAGLLNGVAPVAGPVSNDPDDIRAALLRLWAPWDSTYLGARPAYYTTPGVARMLAFTRDALGNRAFEGVTPTGGTLDGIPLRTSQYLANNGGSGGAPFILVDEAEIYLADDGSVTLDARDDVAVEMDSAPSHNSTTPTAAQLVSMWQTNSVAFKAERFIWWGKRRTGAVNWIDGFLTS